MGTDLPNSGVHCDIRIGPRRLRGPAASWNPLSRRFYSRAVLITASVFLLLGTRVTGSSWFCILRDLLTEPSKRDALFWGPVILLHPVSCAGALICAICVLYLHRQSAAWQFGIAIATVAYGICGAMALTAPRPDFVRFGLSIAMGLVGCSTASAHNHFRLSRIRAGFSLFSGHKAGVAGVSSAGNPVSNRDLSANPCVLGVPSRRNPVFGQ